MMKRDIFNAIDNSRGYTLIEICVVLLIVGLLIAPLGLAYSLYKKEKVREATEISIARITSAIGSYRNMMGHYPCPASLTARRGDANYGHQTDCADPSVAAVGNCENGVCVKPGARTVTLADSTVITPRVRVGAIPFRQLGIDEKYSFDGYGNRITYAVTERLAVLNTFDPNQGGIEIIDEQTPGQSILNVAGSAHFVVVMHGDNGSGVYSAAGTALGGCPGVGALEFENCAALLPGASPAVFRQSNRKEQAGNNYYDDRIVFFARGGSSPWVMEGAGAGGSAGRNIFTKNLNNNSNFGVSVTGAMENENQISGATRSRGRLMTGTITDGASPAAETRSEVIGGALPEMECPAGQFMVGIGDNRARCENEVFNYCPNTGAGYEVVTGVDASGNLICEQVTPPANCPDSTVRLCNTDRPIMGGPHGTIRTITAGTHRERDYICDNGTWRAHGPARGECECWDSDITYQDTCAPWWWEGERLLRWQRTCPAPGISTVLEENCVCRDGPIQAWRAPCPDGYTGSIWNYYRLRCTPEIANGTLPWWHGSAWEYLNVDNTCTCTPRTETRNLACPNGLSGSITETNQFICGATGYWTGWRETSNTCSCDPSQVRVTTGSCPAGEQGEITYHAPIQCPAGTYGTPVEVSRNCSPIPPVICDWKQPAGSGVEESVARGNRIGTTCTCGTTGRCYNTLVPGVLYQNFNSCECN